MKIAGIISEFNPFHNGHKYIIDKIKAENDCVIAVMSGNFVQRGEPAIIEKHKRAKAALLSGVDMVIELPSPWSSSFAENFAFGAVSLLKEAKVGTIYFGSECDDIEALKAIADADFSVNIDQQNGETFAKARENAIKELLGDNYSEILKGANDNLGIEYLKASKKLSFNVKFKTIKRVFASHDSAETGSNICSASLLRENIDSSLFLAQYTPIEAFKIFLEEITNSKVYDEEKYSTAAISYLRRKDDFSSIPDISEGLDMKLKKEISAAENLNQLFELIKSKRYTLARIRRLVLSAFLDQENYWSLKTVPYINILGFSNVGEQALKLISKSSNIPLVFSGKANPPLDTEAQMLFNKECERNDVYASLLKSPYPCGLDYSEGLIKI